MLRINWKYQFVSSKKIYWWKWNYIILCYKVQKWRYSSRFITPSLQSSKNSNPDKKEVVPHCVGGSYPVTKQYAWAELIKHLPWNKYEAWPSQDNMLQLYEQLWTNENCALSLKAPFECIKHIQELFNRGIKEPLSSKDEEESSQYDQSIYEDNNEILGIADNLADISNDMQAQDLSECNLRKKDYWEYQKTKVS
jgi:hypothetical protein